MPSWLTVQEWTGEAWRDIATFVSEYLAQEFIEAASDDLHHYRIKPF